MDKFTRLTAIACPLGLANVDTDQILPARYLKVPRAKGLGPYLFYDLRRTEAGDLDPSFPLNAAGAAVKILVAGRNFGGGSSREAAVYALEGAGIRCVIAPSFGDIFSQNATKNGVLTAVVADEDAAAIAASLKAAPDTPLTVDLERSLIEHGNRGSWPFAIDPARRERLLNGWDDIAMTQSHQAAIAAFKTADRQAHAWKYPAATN
jgi:3-isopropylmalate/(R)-2-methylmalate dehydratase small subunit